MFGIILGSIEKFFRLFQKRNSSRWFENFTSITCRTFVNRTLLISIRALEALFESRDDRTEVTVDTVNSEEKVKKSVSLWENFGYFGTEPCDFSIEKANLPENTLFYINPAYQSFKDGKKVYYNDVFILAQIMPLAHQPKDIGSYQLNDNEVKTLRSRYDPISGEFLGI